MALLRLTFRRFLPTLHGSAISRKTGARHACRNPSERLHLKSRDRFVPRIASAKKNMRKSKAAAERNRAQRAALRTAIKKAKTQGASAADKLKAATLLDRAARKALIHRNAAGRHKSRIAK